MVKTRQRETRKRHHHEVSSSDDSDDSDGNDTPTHKSSRVNSLHSYVQSSAPAHEEDMNRNVKAFQWEFDYNINGKDGIDDGEDDFKELAQELNKEEGLGEPVQ